MPQKNHSNSDSREQLIRAIEYSVIGWHRTLLSGHKHSSTDLLALINFLRNIDLALPASLYESDDRGISETSIKGYRTRLKDAFQFYVNFQSGYVDYGEDLSREDKIKRILPVASYYLHTMLPSHSDEALLLLLKNVSIKSAGTIRLCDPLLALYYIIGFRYAALCGISVDIIYRPLMGSEESLRRVVPLAVVWRAPYINLIARDKKDGKIKQFVMSSILAVTSDLWRDFFKVLTGEVIEREEFDYETYKKDPEYRFLRSIHRYTFRMKGYTFHHFRHTWNLNWELVEERSPTDHIVSITTDDRYTMMMLLYNYNHYIELQGEELIQKGDASIDDCL